MIKFSWSAVSKTKLGLKGRVFFINIGTFVREAIVSLVKVTLVRNCNHVRACTTHRRPRHLKRQVVQLIDKESSTRCLMLYVEQRSIMHILCIALCCIELFKNWNSIFLKAVPIASRDDEASVFWCRRVSFCKTYIMETGRRPPLYVP